MTDKILVAIDHSAVSETVFKTALSLAKKSESSLMLLHVLAPGDGDYPTPLIYSDLVSNMMVDETVFQVYRQKWEQYEQNGYKKLQDLTERANQAKIPTEYTQSFGSPGHKICELANTWEADLIVIGRRGYSGIKEVIMGSTSNYVVHHAPCSVFLVQGEKKPFIPAD